MPINRGVGGEASSVATAFGCSRSEPYVHRTIQYLDKISKTVVMYAWRRQAPKGPRWDAILHPIIPWAQLPYCNWNVTTSTPRANYRNHVPLPLDNRPVFLCI
jgi:hypothetical protein